MTKEFMDVAAVENLLVRIADDIQDSGFKPQVIVGLTRKGLYPAMRLAVMLDVPGECLGSLSTYKDNDGIYRIGKLTQVDVRDKDALAVDDAAKSNGLLPTVGRYLGETAREVRTCAMSAVFAGPDFVGRIGPVPQWYYEVDPRSLLASDQGRPLR